jgi:hypothetical protein
MVKIVCFSMAEMCHCPVSALMERVTVKNVSFSIDGMSHGANRQFHLVRNMSCLKLSFIACLEYVMVKIIRFRMTGMCDGQNCQFQQDWNVSWSNYSIPA